MRVSRVQADANRQTVINVASQLFRKHGFDGISLKDLMKQAGLTHGGFYKQFASKEDLAALATARAVETAGSRLAQITDASAGSELAALLAFYLSSERLNEREFGCPLVALGSDAARGSHAIRAEFEAGIRTHLQLLDRLLGNPASDTPSPASMAILSMMVGALALARMVNDESLSGGFLAAGIAGAGEASSDTESPG